MNHGSFQGGSPGGGAAYGFITKHEALRQIWEIVHTPTKDTTHRSAERHFQSDFDAIRRIIKAAGMGCSLPSAQCEGGK